MVADTKNRLLRKLAYCAVILAVISGIVSFYWACGGTIGLATVGGSIETLAHTTNVAARLLALGAALAKFVGALFALAFIQKWGRRFPTKTLAMIGTVVGSILLVYGLANVITGTLVLQDIVREPTANRYALKWHVFLWDAYFVVWGSVVLLLARTARRVTKHP